MITTTPSTSTSTAAASTITAVPEYYGPTPLFFELIQKLPPGSYVRQLYGNGNDLDETPVVLEPSAVFDPGTMTRRRLQLALEARQSPHTATIVLGGLGR